MIIFVGSEEKGYFAREIAESKDFNMGITFVPSKSSIVAQMNEILMAAKEGAEAIIYDVEQYIDSPETIVDVIARIQNTNGARPIILTPTLAEDNVILRGCLDRGIKDFISDYSNSTDKKSVLVQIITGYFDKNGREDIARIEQVHEEEKAKKSACKSIAVAGACHRVGTTTQAIQITKYLEYEGYKSCYIELNSNKYFNHHTIMTRGSDLSYVEKVRRVAEEKDIEIDDEKLGFCRISKTNMLYKLDGLQELFKKGYDFFVYDYGVYNEIGFNKSAFLKDDRRIFVIGGGVVEIDYGIDVGQNPAYRDSDFIINFAPKKDQDSVINVLNMARCKKDGSTEGYFFTEYTPDPFILSNINLYESLFKDIERKEDSQAAQDLANQVQEKKGLFGRKKRKK